MAFTQIRIYKILASQGQPLQGKTMTLTKKQIWSLILLLGFIFALLASVYLAQQRQEIRPRAVDVTPTPTPIIIGDPECGLKGGVCRSTCQTNETEIQAQGCSSSQPKCCKLPTITPTPTSSPSACLTLPQSDTFNASSLNSSFWDTWVSNYVEPAGVYFTGAVDQSGGVLKAGVPNGNGFAGVITKNKVCGDFDVNIDFSQFTSSGQSEADTILEVSEAGSNKQVFIQYYRKTNEQGFWTALVINNNPIGEMGKVVALTSGKLRIRRQGTVFSTYYDAGKGWVLLGSYPSGFNTNAQVNLWVKSWDQNPSVSANFDNFNLTAAIADPSITLVPTNTPIPSVTPTPTPPSGRDKYTIDVGDKQSLVINISAAIAPQIKFKAKLSSLRSYPEMYLRLRVKDELAFLDNQGNAPSSSDTCNNPSPPDRDFYIPVKANGDIYSPVQQISQPAGAGVTAASVTVDGWVILDGVVPGRYYTLLLKGPKTRKVKMVEHFLLQPNQTTAQNFDWTEKPLDPGDLPDPNNGHKQDCTINSTDWSLQKARIGSTDEINLAVCDVNYDGICNAGDSVAILNTLSKRPDDDL